MVSVGQQSRLCQSQSLSWDCNKSTAQGWGLIWRLSWERIHFQAHVVVDRIWFLEGWGNRGPESLRVVGWRPLSVPCHGDLSTQQLSSSKPKRESASKMEVIIFCNLTAEVTCSQCWCVLLIRNRVVKGRGLNRLWISGGRDRWGHLRSYLPPKETLLWNHQKYYYLPVFKANDIRRV